MDESRGYSMPLPLKYWPRAVAGILWLLLAVFCLASLSPEFRALVDLENTEWLSLRLTAVLTAPAFLAVGLTCFAKLHILPQGVSLSLFGLILRQVPAEKISVFSAVTHSRSLDAVDQIALCMLPLPEILEKERQISTDESRVYHYIYRRSGYFRVNLNLNRDILWLEWSPERLKLLREMYPNVPWVDGSPDRRFDKQLQH